MTIDNINFDEGYHQNGDNFDDILKQIDNFDYPNMTSLKRLIFFGCSFWSMIVCFILLVLTIWGLVVISQMEKMEECDSVYIGILKKNPNYISKDDSWDMYFDIYENNILIEKSYLIITSDEYFKNYTFIVGNSYNLCGYYDRSNPTQLNFRLDDHQHLNTNVYSTYFEWLITALIMIILGLIISISVSITSFQLYINPENYEKINVGLDKQIDF